MPESVLNGVCAIVDKALGLRPIGGKGIGKAPHYRHRKSCLRLSREPPTDFDAKAAKTLISEIYETVKSNFNEDRRRSTENWCLPTNPAKKGDGNEKNREKNIEVKLEREIITTSGGWFNQVPTASGLVNGHADKRASIDLVHRCEDDGSYEFIELKVTSNTPLYAAMEILQYGVLYIFARMNQQMYSAAADKTLLKAATIRLKVLAPCGYYEGCKLDWLENGINEGLNCFIKANHCGFSMNFKFEAFPSYFSVSPSFPDRKAIKEALEDRRSVYQERGRSLVR